MNIISAWESLSGNSVLLSSSNNSNVLATTVDAVSLVQHNAIEEQDLLFFWGFFFVNESILSAHVQSWHDLQV